MQWSRQNLAVAWPFKNLFFQNIYLRSFCIYCVILFSININQVTILKKTYKTLIKMVKLSIWTEQNERSWCLSKSTNLSNWSCFILSSIDHVNFFLYYFHLSSHLYFMFGKVYTHTHTHTHIYNFFIHFYHLYFLGYLKSFPCLHDINHQSFWFILFCNKIVFDILKPYLILNLVLFLTFLRITLSHHIFGIVNNYAKHKSNLI